jgi:hypothetical protein
MTTTRLFPKVVLILSLLFFIPSVSFALNANDLMGEYSLTAFKIQFDGQSMITSAQASSFSGRLSMTTKGYVADMSGSVGGVYTAQYYCGFYTTNSWNNTVSISIKGGSSGSMDVSISNGTLVTTGYTYDDDGYRYWFEYIWQKNQVYYTTGGYTQAQLDLAVKNAEAIKDGIIASMFTQNQLNQSVANAEAAKNLIIAAKELEISSMFTQDQLNQAASNIEAAKDIIIAEKNAMISQKDITISILSDLDGDQTTDMKDIVWGLQVLSGKK